MLKKQRNPSALSGKAFDPAYINNEVAYHKAVISTVEGLLITQAQNKELKDLLQSVVPALKAHLMHAQIVQKKFCKMKGPYIIPGIGAYFMFLILLLYGCVSSPGKKIHKLYTVEISQMQFQPSELTVEKGDTVVFINKDLLVHNVTDENNKSWSSSPLSTDKSYMLVCRASSNYYCVFHPTMKGRITVGH